MPDPPIPGLPSPEERANISAAMAAKDAVRDLGGDPAAIDALAMLRSQVVEGVTLFANPPATYCALRLIKDFFPKAPAPAADPLTEETAMEMDQLVAMAYAFAEPVRAYLTARQGMTIYFQAAFDWTARHFPTGDAAYRLGRVAGWCAGILQTLEALNPRTPAETLANPEQAPTAAPASPPAPTQDSSPPSSTGSWRNTTNRANPPSPPSLWRRPSPSGPPASSAKEETPPAPVPK